MHEAEFENKCPPLIRLLLPFLTVATAMHGHLWNSHYQVVPVKMIRVAKFITDVVAKRKIPLSGEVTKPRWGLLIKNI